MENDLTFLEKKEFCKKFGIPFKEFWFNYEIFLQKQEEDKIRRIIEKAQAKKLFRDFLVKALTRAA